jgi:hypothetical protein
MNSRTSSGAGQYQDKSGSKAAPASHAASRHVHRGIYHRARRHPFNIMLQRDIGKIIDIEFEDCFEANKIRRSFLERVPFILTCMLIKAMGACKTEGIFEQACEKIMKILRTYKDSLLVFV